MREVDPWRFTGSFLRKVLSARIPDKPVYEGIPWATPQRPLSQSKLALVSTAGLSIQEDDPFDMDGERRRPTWGDPSWRRIAADANSRNVAANHLHIDTGYIEADLNVALPLDRLRELVADGVVGAMAETHYSIMGYQGSDASTLTNESAPAIARSMASEEVDLVLLAPV